MEFKRGLDPRKALRIGPARTIEKHLQELKENYNSIIERIDVNLDLNIVIFNIYRINKPSRNGHDINMIIKNHPINEYIHKNYASKNETHRNFVDYFYFKIRKEYWDVFSTLELPLT